MDYVNAYIKKWILENIVAGTDKEIRSDDRTYHDIIYKTGSPYQNSVIPLFDTAHDSNASVDLIRFTITSGDL